MTNTSPASNQSHRAHLRAIAVQAMRERGLDPDFPSDALAETAALKAAPTTTEEPTRDLRSLLWCSIDNDDSRDLDQLSVAEALPGGDVRVMVAIADVDAAVPKGSPVDRHAALNTTSVYTPAVIFPMLPEKLSTDLTSLADHQDRLSVVIEFVVAPGGELKSSDMYGALVRNQAKLAYNSVGAWLAGGGPLPPAAAAVPGMDEQLRMQDRVAQALNGLRAQHGALEFETIEVENVFDGDTLHDVRPQMPNRAKSLIANLMIAANGVTARFLDAHGFPSLRRVVKSPERWDRIRAVAEQLGEKLPVDADSLALAGFLTRRKQAAPATFPDLSLTVIRLLGRGEYVVDPPRSVSEKYEHAPSRPAPPVKNGRNSQVVPREARLLGAREALLRRAPSAELPGHFGLAVRDYSHSTAPNRRYPDLVTQRLVKAALASHPSPYGIGELEQVAAHCTQQEDAANKVERQVRKSAAALVVESRVGDQFDAVVTGASPKGTFVRVSDPPIEGKLMGARPGLDVGDRLRVRLSGLNVDRGFIDFQAA